MSNLKLRLLSLTEHEAKILYLLIRQSNPPVHEQDTVVNIMLKLEKIINE